WTRRVRLASIYASAFACHRRVTFGIGRSSESNVRGFERGGAAGTRVLDLRCCHARRAWPGTPGHRERRAGGQESEEEGLRQDAPLSRRARLAGVVPNPWALPACPRLAA